MQLRSTHLVAAAIALPLIGFSLACGVGTTGSDTGVENVEGDFTRVDCDTWSIVDGDCSCTYTYAGSDTHMQITRTFFTVGGSYSGAGKADAFGTTSTRTISSGSGNTNTFNGSRNPTATPTFTFTLLDDTSGSTNASECSTAWGTVVWEFQDVDASSARTKVPGAFGPVEAICDPSEQQHDSERKLHALPGSPRRVALAMGENRTEWGAAVERIEILDFAGAQSIQLVEPDGTPVVLTPANPVAHVDLAASDLGFTVEPDHPLADPPRALIRTSCLPQDAESVAIAQGYQIGTELIGIGDPEIAQELTARIVDDPMGAYLSVTPRGSRVGSTVRLVPDGPESWRVDDERLPGTLVLTPTPGGLEVVGDILANPVDLVLPHAI